MVLGPGCGGRKDLAGKHSPCACMHLCSLKVCNTSAAAGQVRDAGNLLTRAGLSIPSVDLEDVTVHYRTPLELVQHLRCVQPCMSLHCMAVAIAVILDPTPPQAC